MPRKHQMPPPISGFNALAEQRIREAQAQGMFDDLPGAGAPLNLDDDAMVPEELRAAYRILKKRRLRTSATLRKIKDLEDSVA